MSINEHEDRFNRIYIEFIDYIGRNFAPSMQESTTHAESLTNIVRQEIEEAESNEE